MAIPREEGYLTKVSLFTSCFHSRFSLFRSSTAKEKILGPRLDHHVTSVPLAPWRADDMSS
jgi:hypothetical protein